MIETKTSRFRRFYRLVSVFALVNLLMLGGLAGYGVSTGQVNLRKIEQIVAVLRGQDSVPTGVASANDRAPVLALGAPIGAAAQAPPPSPQEVDILRLEVERAKVELDQQLTLVNSIMLKVTTEREAFKREQEAAARQGEESLRARRQEGFKKQVEIYEGLAPKVALEHMLNLDDPDQAARILVELDARKAKKIVEAAHDAEQVKRIQVILQRVQDVAPDRSEQLAGTQP